jgi:molybdopterin synthase catalytic subunit
MEDLYHYRNVAIKILAVHKKGTLSISNLLENTRKKPDFYKVGAIATFIGVVRGETKEGKTVKGLELEAYKGKADEVLQNICRELQAKESIQFWRRLLNGTRGKHQFSKKRP